MKLTVKDILALKGKRKLTEVFVENPEQAAAAEKAGVDMLCGYGDVRRIRAAAPNTFLIGAMGPEAAQSEAIAIRLGQAMLSQGADAVYTGISTKRVKSMVREFIPVVGHVGLVPYRCTWHGGYKAVGKTAEEAKAVYDLTRRYADAGAIAVEMEIVPHKVAAMITQHVDLITISMGSGVECDAQYLFSCDLLGTNQGHIPRHAKVYANLHAEYERISAMMTEAYRQYHQDVQQTTYPATEHSLPINEHEWERFRAAIGL